MDDSDGILGSIGDVIGEVASAVGDEAKKFGHSATSQVSGGTASQSTAVDDFSPLDELKKIGKSVTSQVSGASGATNDSKQFSASGQLAGFGKSLVGQVTGSEPLGENSDKKKPTAHVISPLDELSKIVKSATSQVSGNEALDSLKKADDDFSTRESEVIRTKIARVYEEYAQKRKQEEMTKKQQTEQAEVQKKQVEDIKEKNFADEVNPAIAKSRAENKNYGAE